MTLEEARAFVTYVHEATGKWPGLDGGHYLKELLGMRPVRSWLIGGFGSRNTDLVLRFRLIGGDGRFGNIPTPAI